MYRDIYNDHLDDNKNNVDYSRSYNDRNFYAPKKRAGKMHVRHAKFVETIKRIFSEGGNYSDVARELMVSPSAVYTRVKKLKAQGDNSLPAISTVSHDAAADAVGILNELGVNVEYTPTASLENMSASVAVEANEILRQLGME
jgi:transposase-like protein